MTDPNGNWPSKNKGATIRTKPGSLNVFGPPPKPIIPKLSYGSKKGAAGEVETTRRDRTFPMEKVDKQREFREPPIEPNPPTPPIDLNEDPF